LEVVCIVHAIRTGRVFPWLYILILVPLIGSVIYLFSELLPDLRSSREAHAVRRGVTKFADPDRDLRTAKRDVELVGSAEAKRKLAEEYMLRGGYRDAADLYRSALTGAHADDPALLYGLARAQMADGDGAGAQASLDALQKANPNFTSADAHLLYTRALEIQGKDEEALAEYEALVRYFPGEEARCRYGLLLRKAGHTERARAVFSEVLKLTDGAPKRYKTAQREWSDLARRNLASG
jgi:hypothetical protein